MAAADGCMAPRLHGGFAWFVYSGCHGLPLWSFRPVARRRLGARNGNGRSGEIRTPGPLVPNQMRYQAALHSDVAFLSPLQLFFKPSSLAKSVLFHFFAEQRIALLTSQRQHQLRISLNTNFGCNPAI